MGEDNKNLELLYEVIKEHFTEEFRMQNIKDKKATVLLILSSLLVLTSIYLNLFLSTICFLIAVAYALLVLMPRDWRHDPDPYNLWYKYYGKDYKETLEQIIANIVDSDKENVKKDNKAKYLQAGYIAFYAGLTVMVIQRVAMMIK